MKEGREEGQKGKKGVEGRREGKKTEERKEGS